MSRRTKFLLLTPLFLLLGIVVVYFFITWHPANPLRFRVVDVPLPSLGQYHSDTQVTVAVENVTSSPIYLRYMTMPPWIRGSRNVIGAIVSREQLAHRAGPQGNYLLVPARSTIHVAALVRNEHLEDVRGGKLTAGYKWMSHSKFLCQSLSQSLADRLPKGLSRLLPLPAHGEDVTPVEALEPSPR